MIPATVTTVTGEVYRWVACSVAEFGSVGAVRHLAAPGAVDTVCHSSATVLGIWRGNRTKPACPLCQAWADRTIPKVVTVAPGAGDDQVDDALRRKAGAWQGLHIARGFGGPSDVDDACPCPKEPRGFVASDRIDPGCPEHPVRRGKTIRATHAAGECPALTKASAL